MDANFFNDPAIFSLIAGLVLLGVDIFIIGLSPVMFVALGALAAGVILYVTGWRVSLVGAAALWAVISLVITAVGWRPLRRFQSADVQEDESSDLIGRELVATHEVTKAGGVVHWSGVEWQAQLSDDAAVDALHAGERARVVKVKNLALILEPVL
jgi:membrane protein implicated in regulation of membrane protease activity